MRAASLERLADELLKIVKAFEPPPGYDHVAALSTHPADLEGRRVRLPHVDLGREYAELLVHGHAGCQQPSTGESRIPRHHDTGGTFAFHQQLAIELAEHCNGTRTGKSYSEFPYSLPLAWDRPTRNSLFVPTPGPGDEAVGLRVVDHDPRQRSYGVVCPSEGLKVVEYIVAQSTRDPRFVPSRANGWCSEESAGVRELQQTGVDVGLSLNCAGDPKLTRAESALAASLATHRIASNAGVGWEEADVNLLHRAGEELRKQPDRVVLVAERADAIEETLCPPRVQVRDRDVKDYIASLLDELEKLENEKAQVLYKELQAVGRLPPDLTSSRASC